MGLRPSSSSHMASGVAYMDRAIGMFDKEIRGSLVDDWYAMRCDEHRTADRTSTNPNSS
jgi:hypothetical protein